MVVKIWNQNDWISSTKLVNATAFCHVNFQKYQLKLKNIVYLSCCRTFFSKIWHWCKFEQNLEEKSEFDNFINANLTIISTERIFFLKMPISKSVILKLVFHLKKFCKKGKIEQEYQSFLKNFTFNFKNFQFFSLLLFRLFTAKLAVPTQNYRFLQKNLNFVFNIVINGCWSIKIWINCRL